MRVYRNHYNYYTCCPAISSGYWKFNGSLIISGNCANLSANEGVCNGAVGGYSKVAKI